MTHFTAADITILRLNGKVDRHGQVFPKECHVVIPDYPVPVTFNHDHTSVIGLAKIGRKGNKLVADIRITSKMENSLEALRLIRMLTPSIEAEIVDSNEHIVTSISVRSVSLVTGMNADPGIKPLGDKVRCASPKTKAGLH